MRAHTYEGCKVTGWEFSVSDNETAKLKLTIDGQTELTATALATAAFTSAEIFNFQNVSVFKTGGTVTGVPKLRCMEILDGRHGAGHDDGV